MMYKNLRILSLFILMATPVWLSAAEPYFFSVNANKGEGILSLLSKYDLLEFECNKTLFYQMNNLNQNDYLIAGKEYTLPIKIYEYNGKSIRSTIGTDDYQKALRIQSYNEKILAKGLRTTDFKDSKILWVPYHELECAPNPEANRKEESSENDSVVLVAEKSEAVVIQKLFGKNYEEVNIIDDRLKDKVFFIVSGHGGPDPGAMCSDCREEMCEDEYAYDVALRLCRNLTQHGATVHMIIEDRNDGIRDEEYLKCDKDETILTGAKLPYRQLDRLKQRADAINDLSAKYKKKGLTDQTALMIHVDSRAKDKQQDVFFYYYGSDSSKELAYKVRDVFEQKYDTYQKGRGYHGYVDERGLFMLRKTHPTAVYVELANIRNQSDHKRLILRDNRQALANWLFEGLTK